MATLQGAHAGGECARAGAALVQVTVLAAIHRTLSGAGSLAPPPATSGVAQASAPNAPELNATHPPGPPGASSPRRQLAAIAAGIGAPTPAGPGAVFWVFVGLVLFVVVALLTPRGGAPSRGPTGK
jgi:hypothetical protein